MKLSIKVDKNKISEVERELGAYYKQAPNALYRALNRAATNVNSNIKKEVRKKYNIKAGDVNDTLTKTKASKNNLSATVRSSGELISLDKFKVSPKTVNPKRKSPIKVGVKKDGVKVLMGAFVADIHGAKVFKREGKERLPIKKLFGPSVPQMIGNEEVKKEIENKGQETFDKRLEYEIDRIMKRG